MRSPYESESWNIQLSNDGFFFIVAYLLCPKILTEVQNLKSPKLPWRVVRLLTTGRGTQNLTPEPGVIVQLYNINFCTLKKFLQQFWMDYQFFNCSSFLMATYFFSKRLQHLKTLQIYRIPLFGMCATLYSRFLVENIELKTSMYVLCIVYCMYSVSISICFNPLSG